MTMIRERYILKNMKESIDRLSELLNILPFYYNYKGERIEIPTETKAEIISSMGIEINESALKEWIEYFEFYKFRENLDSVYVTGEKPQIYIYLDKPLENPVEIEIIPHETLGTFYQSLNIRIDLPEIILSEVRYSERGEFYKYLIHLPSLPPGYYKLKAYLRGKDAESIVIVSPEQCYLHFQNKTWGLHLNLWSLRGRGIEGDFSHLKELAQYVKSMGGFISINPLHYNDPSDAYGISPYSAISRQFKTPIYLSDIAVEEKNESFFEYGLIWDEKMSRLKERFYNLNNKAGEFLLFEDYKNRLNQIERQDLKLFAIFCFLAEKFGKNWLSWKEQFRNADKEALEEIYRENYLQVSFYEYLQWLVDREIEALKEYEICFDLGFGSIHNSFDVWINRDLYALKCEHGAPPDDFNPKGQKWGFPPLIPFKMRQTGYMPFIKILRANMKNRLMRIDHALGLFRAFWIPEGKSPAEGAYVGYPWSELLGIICLESHLNRTAIIGEDLGTAEEWMREELLKRKIASWRVFYFEKENSNFKKANQYPEEALCSITTHDLPTLKGFIRGKDLELRKKFNLLEDFIYEKAHEDRIRDIEKILELIQVNHEEETEKILLALVSFLSSTNSKYLLLYPEDILLVEEQTNLPGTTNEYPNWQRKLPITVNQITNLPILRKIESILKETGRVSEYH